MEWISEALDKVGSFTQLHKAEPLKLTIKDYRVLLPCNLVNLVTVNIGDTKLRYGNSDWDGITQMQRVVTDTDGAIIQSNLGSQFSYVIQFPYLILPFQTGTCTIVYECLPVDEDGFPMIIDRESLKEACVKYVIMKENLGEFIKGNISPQIYQKLEYDWTWYCGQARGDLNMPTADQIESMKNLWLQLRPNVNHFNSNFNILNKR